MSETRRAFIAWVIYLEMDCRLKILLRLFLADVKSYSTFDILGRIAMAIFAALKLGFTPM